jgi:prepilin-type N-terminal cleavage/methylation domain-containing protein
MRYSLKIRSGFTLIEVALAATILLVGFAGMAEALIIGSEMLDTARKQTIAVQILQTEIEYLRLRDWTTIQNLPPSSGPDYLSNYPDFAQTNLPSITGTKFKFARSVNGDPTPNVRWITITVSWTGLNGSWTTGTLHYRSCNAYIGKYGLNVSYQKL